MPLKAIHQDTGESIYIFDYEDREEIDIKLKPLQWQGVLRCGNPDCQAELMVRNGGIVTPHFAHKGHQCRTKYEHCPESLEHERGKILIGQHVQKRFERWAKVQVEYEVPIPSMKRIADVVIQFNNGILQAHELQLASITTEQLQRRTIDYHKEGIDVQWWLGGKANTEANRRWISEKWGWVSIVDPTREDLQDVYEITNSGIAIDAVGNIIPS